MPSRYLSEFFKPKQLSRMVNESARIIKALPSVKAIVVTGTSGLLIGPQVAAKCKIPLVVVRKRGEASHASDIIEYNEFALYPHSQGNYVILDDFVSTGQTAKRVMKEVNDEFPNFTPLCVIQAARIYETYSLETVLVQVGPTMTFDLQTHFGANYYTDWKRYGVA